MNIGKLIIKENGKQTDWLRVAETAEGYIATDASAHEVRISDWAEAMNFCNTNWGYTMGNGDYYYESRKDMTSSLTEDGMKADEVAECVANAPAYLFADEMRGSIEFEC